MLGKFKEVVAKEKHERQVDNLKQQLSTNCNLWEQLAEANQREKVLKQEMQ